MNKEDPDILLIFGEAIASILDSEVDQSWPGYTVTYCNRYIIWLDSGVIRDASHGDTVHEFNLADPDVSPEMIAAKVIELKEAREGMY